MSTTFQDLAIEQRKTSGDVPPASVGSTITIIGRTLYVIAGRLVATRRLTPSVYALDLDTYIWTKISIKGSIQPTARYFHSANGFGDMIVIFGGMSVTPDTVDTLCVLDDIAIFDTKQHTWEVHVGTVEPGQRPRPRYAHLSTISAGKLIIAGGQELKNDYLEDAAIFDLQGRSWLGTYPISKQCGAYRSMIVSPDESAQHYHVIDADTELRTSVGSETETSSFPASSLRSEGGMFPLSMDEAIRRASQVSLASTALSTSTAGHRPNLRKRSEAQIPTVPDCVPTPNLTGPMYMYSNFNFTDVQRELLKIDAAIGVGIQMQVNAAATQGPLLPPGLRFPSGTIVGNHMLVYGTYLTNSSQRYSIWALDLTTFTWSKCDPGERLASGSWNKAVYCAAKGSFIVVGNHDRSLVDDYNHRQCNFDHLTLLDLEMFGIISSTESRLSPSAREVGLLAMQEPLLCETDIVTAERTIIPVSSKIIGTKWPTFLEILQNPVAHERGTSRSPTKNGFLRVSENVRPSSMGSTNSRLSHLSIASNLLNDAISRPRCVYMPYPHAQVHAFVRFLYTDLLPASFELAVSRVCPLLLFCASLADSKTNPYLIRLMRLCRHCLHRLLSIENAAYIYETATMSGQRGLLVRALTMMVAAKKENAMHASHAALASSAEVK